MLKVPKMGQWDLTATPATLELADTEGRVPEMLILTNLSTARDIVFCVNNTSLVPSALAPTLKKTDQARPLKSQIILYLTSNYIRAAGVGGVATMRYFAF